MKFVVESGCVLVDDGCELPDEQQLVIEGEHYDESLLAALVAQANAAQWTPITPENLPKVGDEVVDLCGPSRVIDIMARWTMRQWQETRWTHFRSLAPAPAPAPQDAGMPTGPLAHMFPPQPGDTERLQRAVDHLQSRGPQSPAAQPAVSDAELVEAMCEVWHNQLHQPPMIWANFYLGGKETYRSAMTAALAVARQHIEGQSAARIAEWRAETRSWKVGYDAAQVRIFQAEAHNAILTAQLEAARAEPSADEVSRAHHIYGPHHLMGDALTDFLANRRPKPPKAPATCTSCPHCPAILRGDAEMREHQNRWHQGDTKGASHAASE